LQRIHAVLFHQGASVCTDLGATAGRARLAQVAREQLSAAGQAQVRAAVLMLEATEAQIEVIHRQLLATARHMKGPNRARPQPRNLPPCNRKAIQVSVAFGRAVGHAASAPSGHQRYR
jgi:hypothetical protein